MPIHELIEKATVADVTRLLRLLIEAGLELNSPASVDSRGFTPIHRVLMWKNQEFEPLFSLMARAGAKLDVSVLYYKDDCVKVYGDKPRTLISQAALQGSLWALQEIKALDPYKIQPDWNDAVISAARADHLDVVQYLLEHLDLDPGYGSGESALASASSQGHTRIVEYLLKSHRARVNIEALDSHNTSLYHACRNGFSEIVQLLLEHGADPHRSGTEIPWGSVTCASPLEIASSKGHALAVQHILRTQLSPSGRDTCGEALYRACRGGHVEASRVLLAHDADPNWSIGFRKGNWSCLHAAVKSGNKGIVELLLEHGATVTVRTVPVFSGGRPMGNTPIKIAEENGHREIVTMLIAAKTLDRAKRTIGEKT